MVRVEVDRNLAVSLDDLNRLLVIVHEAERPLNIVDDSEEQVKVSTPYSVNLQTSAEELVLVDLRNVRTGNLEGDADVS